MSPLPVQTVPSEETDDSQTDSSAFQVLNQDNLKPLELSIPTIKPLPTKTDSTKQSTKPNVIVYPTRRIDNNEYQRQRNLARSNNYIYNQNAQNNLQNNRNYSSSYGNLNSSAGSTKKSGKKTTSADNIADLDFTKSLGARLRQLQQNASSLMNRSQNGLNGSINRLNLNNSQTDVRKPFVTVVKKGRFLNPPPEIATKLGLEPEEDDTEKIEKFYLAKRLYAYASKPKVLNRGVGIKGNSGGRRRGDQLDESDGSVISNKEQKKFANGGHKSKCEASFAAAATLASGVAGFRRFKREANGEWRPQGDMQYGNIMFDRRVVRGNTYALHPMPTGDGESQAARQAEARRRAIARRKAQAKQFARLGSLGSPPPVAGRKHEVIQTERYLEELFDHPECMDVVTQTDLFLDRPVSPFYYPAKVGQDAETQIYPGDLFDFDVEVQPILEVLVGKTIEQALIEVLEEEELAALREQQRRFEEIRNAEVAETQRLEERERRYRQEKDRRMAEHREGQRIQKETEERVAASVLIQGYVADLLPNVLEGLKEDGFLVDNIKHEVDQGFMPWLMKEVSTEMENMVTSRDVLTDLVREIIENRNELYRALYATPPESSGEEGSDLTDYDREEEGQYERVDGEEVNVAGGDAATPQSQALPASDSVRVPELTLGTVPVAK